MSSNKYKKAMLDEKLNEDEILRLCEKINSYNVKDSEIKSERNFRPRLIAAAAAAVIAVTTVGAAASAVGKGLYGMSRHEEQINNEVNSFGAIPTLKDPVQYANDLYIKGTSDNSPEDEPEGAAGTISPVLTAAAGDGHTLIAIIEVETGGLEMPEDMPSEAVLGFESVSENLSKLEQPPELVSCENGCCTFALTRASIKNIPKTVEIELNNFGYYVGDAFIPICSGPYKISADSGELDTVSELVKISGPQDVMGAALNVEITPLGILIYGSRSKIVEAGLENDKYALSQPTGIAIHMSDGSEISAGDDRFTSPLYDLICTVHGWIDFDNDVVYYHYGFTVPLNTDEVSAVSVLGTKFEF